jgi:hypothetical protein
MHFRVAPHRTADILRLDEVSPKVCVLHEEGETEVWHNKDSLTVIAITNQSSDGERLHECLSAQKRRGRSNKPASKVATSLTPFSIASTKRLISLGARRENGTPTCIVAREGVLRDHRHLLYNLPTRKSIRTCARRRQKYKPVLHLGRGLEGINQQDVGPITGLHHRF